MDAESYSLHTFEALLTQSMENLGNFGALYFTFSGLKFFFFLSCALQSLQRAYQAAIREVHIPPERVSIALFALLVFAVKWC